MNYRMFGEAVNKYKIVFVCVRLFCEDFNGGVLFKRVINTRRDIDIRNIESQYNEKPTCWKINKLLIKQYFIFIKSMAFLISRKIIQFIFLSFILLNQLSHI